MHLQQEGRRRTVVGRLCMFLVFALFASSLSLTLPTPSAQAASKLVMVGQQPITAGATLRQYEWYTTRNKKDVKIKANVIIVDLTNPYVRMDLMTGKNNQFTNRQTVKQMATETGAVAGVNGDFFNMNALGVSMGGGIWSSEVMSTPAYLPGFYSFALTGDNKPVIDLFTFEGMIAAEDGSKFALSGVNKEYYWFEPSGQHSMIDAMILYTDKWGSQDRANDGVTVPTEVLVQNGEIQQIAINSIIRMEPPEDGFILRASGKAADYVKEHLKVGEKLDANYEIVPQNPSTKYDTKNFRMMIGGHTILVDGGKAAAFSRNVAEISSGAGRSRTGIGYTQDGTRAMIMTADLAGDSDGMTLAEMQQFMIEVGIWKGMNLDGGGSTQMVARPLGENDVKLVNTTEKNNGERRVVNGIGIYSSAPRGKALSFSIVGDKQVFLNEEVKLSIRGYDEYYNPFPTNELTAQWHAADGAGTFEGNVFTAKKAGTATIGATSGLGAASTTLKVVSRKDIAALTIKPSKTIIAVGDEIKLSMQAKLKDNTEKVLSGKSFEWTMRGFEGEIDGDTLKVTGIQPGQVGQLIASYDGFSTMIPLSTGSKELWTDFENVDWTIGFSGSPQEITGTAEITSVPNDQGTDNNALQLTYDMSKGKGTKAAYMHFGTDGIAIPGKPQALIANIHGDDSKHWLRAELVDANGVTGIVDLASSVNWTGWKSVSVDVTNWKSLSTDLSAYSIQYPIKLKRIYAANVEQGQGDRAATGQIAIDDITFDYHTSAVSKPRNKVKLFIGDKNITVNGEKFVLDEAPYLTDGNTMIPLRFVVQALDGQIEWDKHQWKATAIRDQQIAEFWINEKGFTANGKLIQAEVPTILKVETTMIPLRVLSETLGWKVDWNPDEFSVTLE